MYNWTRLDQTVDSYLAAGITPLLVLDNIPYAFVAPQHREFIGFGLTNPPDNVTEFGIFIEEMARHLVDRYNEDLVATWRFRVGTEADGPRLGPRWDDLNFPGAGLQQYILLYDAVVAALRRVLSAPIVGPSNMAQVGPVNCSVCEQLFEFGRHLYNGTNTADPSTTGSIISFAALSEYSKSDNIGAPAQEMAGTIETMKQFVRLATTGKSTGSEALRIPLEVHEYGWAGWLHYNISSTWPAGAYGGAWNVASWLFMLQAGASKIFHWGYGFDNSLAQRNLTGTMGGKPLVSAWGWVLGAMEELGTTDGAKSNKVRLETDEVTHKNSEYSQDSTSGTGGLSSVATAVLPASSSPRMPSQATVGAYRVATPSENKLQYLLVAHSADTGFNTPPANDPVITWRLLINASDMPNSTSGGYFNIKDGPESIRVGQRALTRGNSIHDIILSDLEQAGGYAAGLLVGEDQNADNVNHMATETGQKLAAKHAAAYMEANLETLGPIGGTITGAEKSGELADGGRYYYDEVSGGLVLNFYITVPSLMLLTLSPWP